MRAQGLNMPERHNCTPRARLEGKKEFTPTPMNIGVSSQGERGFTLVELIVSLALFIIVIFIVTSSFLNIVHLHKKAQTVRIAMDTMSVALENMARNIRIGSTYHCFTGSEGLNDIQYYPSQNPPNSGIYYPNLTSQDCSSGSKGMLFYVPADSSEGVELRGYYYRNQFDSPNPYSIQSRGGGTCCSYLTSPKNIKITNLKFYVTGTQSGTLEQPRVVIVVQGTAGTDPLTKTNFSIYTSVTQRIPKF